MAKSGGSQEMSTTRPSSVTPHFHADLALLKQELAREGALVAERLSQAMKGLVNYDLDMLDEVAIGDAEVNAMQMDIDDRAFKLLALHQPVATDLRMIVAAIKINSDLERIGDLAVNIAEAARRYFAAGRVEEQQLLPRMNEIAETMLRDALDSFVTNNLGTAQAVLERDDTLDSFREQVNRRLIERMTNTPSTVSSALELMLIGRHLERVGDHATNIAEDVFFVVVGEDIRHQMQVDFTDLKDKTDTPPD
jgi:phosphate transport system protein